MARRGVPKGKVSWYLREWMDACDIRGRGAGARMQELTGWSKASTSQLINGGQDFSPKVLHDAATALNAQPYELLMLPEKAFAIRRMYASAIRLAHDAEVQASAPAPVEAPTDSTDDLGRTSKGPVRR